MNRQLSICACVSALCSAAWAQSANPDAGAAAQFLPAVIAQAQPAPAQPAAQPTPQERIAMLKQWLQASQKQIRAYEWIETTVTSKDGEEKSRIQNRCYYGMDGKLQKVPVSETGESGGGGPIRRHREEKMEAYMKSAAALVHSYIPPDPERIQNSVAAGKFSFNLLQPGRLVRLEFRDYLKPGDMLGVEIELPTNRLTKVTVASYLDSPKDAVTLDVGMGVLSDGTIYPAQSVLDAAAKGVKVDTQNTGYRPMSR